MRSFSQISLANLFIATFLFFAPQWNISACAADVQGAAEPASPAAWYGEGVRPTEARSPEEELAGFHIAPGFEVRLFAAEPQIAKPMNLAFDNAGRVWVTDSVEYPYQATEAENSRDSIRILVDTDQDGRADSSTVFADNLNIPIGLLPYADGCFCFSIPNIYFLRDLDGDNVCDSREVVLGPFDTTRDTHGMVNAMRAGDDGWIYANHGFNNQTTVSGRDGHSITMHSGNSFRFRPDGSRVELVTSGQVNPFGRTSDDWGYDYSADCHSKPITQLIRGACYPSFGRPDDGLGFLPPMMDHLHGSTAISGLTYIPESLNLPSLSNQMLSGNVMTSRINRNRVVYHGATAKAEEIADFLTSDDPWFRPVDIRLGPDGYVYVADFYNRIIGHYEVPLEHPGRDRFRGRIWQIRAKTNDKSPPYTSASVLPSSIADWNHGNPTRRLLALENAVRAADPQLTNNAKSILQSKIAGYENARITSLAYLLRRGQLTTDLACDVLASDLPLVRANAMRLVANVVNSRSLDFDTIIPIAVISLRDSNPHVRRAAAELIGLHGSSNAIADLLSALDDVKPDDPVLRQSIRIAIRNILHRQGSLDQSPWLAPSSLSTNHASELAEIMLAVKSPLAGSYLADYLSQRGQSDSRTKDMLRHAVQTLSAGNIFKVVNLARQLSKDSEAESLELLDLIASAAKNATREELESLSEWGNELAGTELKSALELVADKQRQIVAWSESVNRNWMVQSRNTEAGSSLPVFSSILHGETYTGTYQTSPFKAPDQISFWIVGHNGVPDQPDNGKNWVELVDADSKQVLMTARPPRSDIAQKVNWNLQKHSGKNVILRCIDTDSGTAYAWLAVGGFQPDWVGPQTVASPLSRFLDLVTRHRLASQRPGLVTLVKEIGSDNPSSARVASVIATLDNRAVLAKLLQAVSDFRLTGNRCEALVGIAAGQLEFDAVSECNEISKSLSASEQRLFADRLSSDKDSILVMIEAIESGSLATDVLNEKDIWQRVSTIANDDLLKRATQLRAKAPPVNASAERAMQEVLVQSSSLKYDERVATELFTKQCMVCHQLAGKGQVVGPQLDGVGGRGTARLAEDLMIPDRNVDKAFRTTTFLMVDGRVLTGLVRDENNDRVLLVGQDGKATELLVDEIEQRRDGTNSLMPGNLYETLGTEAMAMMIRYLSINASQKSGQ